MPTATLDPTPVPADLASFETLFREMYSPLVGFVSAYLGDTGRAEEVVQDLFFAIWQDRGQWVIRTSLRAYLFSAARNRGFNILRRDRVERDWESDESQDDVRALHPTPKSTDLRLVTDDEHQRLRNAMASLPERCARIMQLRWMDELSYREIAEVLEISEKAVEKQISRGLRLLREKLAGE